MYMLVVCSGSGNLAKEAVVPTVTGEVAGLGEGADRKDTKLSSRQSYA